MNTTFQSKTPITYYFLLAFLVFTIILFSIFAIIERLDVTSSIFCIILSNLIVFYLFGRYICRLTLTEDKIQLTFLYPFKTKREYAFTGISELDFRGASLQNINGKLVPELDPVINRGFYRLYLIDNNGKLFDIKYNISQGDNEKLMKILVQKIK
jgi:hypothetical protein